MSGRLNFSEDTGKTLGLKDKMSIKFAIDENGKLYCSFPKEDDEDAFKIRKAGRYFYVPTDLLFSSLGIDYKKINIQYNLVRAQLNDDELNGKTYRMDETLRTLRNKEEDRHEIIE